MNLTENPVFISRKLPMLMSTNFSKGQKKKGSLIHPHPTHQHLLGKHTVIHAKLTASFADYGFNQVLPKVGNTKFVCLELKSKIITDVEDKN